MALQAPSGRIGASASAPTTVVHSRTRHFVNALKAELVAKRGATAKIARLARESGTPKAEQTALFE